MHQERGTEVAAEGGRRLDWALLVGDLLRAPEVDADFARLTPQALLGVSHNKLVAKLAGTGSLEDMFLEAVQPHWFEWCQGTRDWAGGGCRGGQAPVCGCQWWGRRGQRGWGCQQHLGGALELRA